MSKIETATVKLPALQAAIRDASFHEVLPDSHSQGGFSILFSKREHMETFFDSITEYSAVLQRKKTGL